MTTTTNLNVLEERTLAYVVGTDSEGRGGKQTTSTLEMPGKVSGPESSVDGNLAAFSGAVGGAVADSGIATSDIEAMQTKTDFLTVTGAVDLDTINTRVNALDAAVVLKGTWDASSGSFPGSGSAQAGESWIVSTGGTVDGVIFTANDRIIAITDNASTSTFASNWFKADYTDLVSSVDGATGAVTLGGIISAASAKTGLVDADLIGASDSEASGATKKITWANIKATLKTYFDTLYGALASVNVWTKGQRGQAVALDIDGGEVDWNLADGNIFTLTVDANFLLNLPADIATHDKQFFSIILTQDGTGGWDMTVSSGIEPFNSPTLFSIAQGAGTVTIIDGRVIDGSTIVLSAGGVGVLI